MHSSLSHDHQMPPTRRTRPTVKRLLLWTLFVAAVADLVATFVPDTAPAVVLTVSIIALTVTHEILGRRWMRSAALVVALGFTAQSVVMLPEMSPPPHGNVRTITGAVVVGAVVGMLMSLAAYATVEGGARMIDWLDRNLRTPVNHVPPFASDDPQ